MKHIAFGRHDDWTRWIGACIDRTRYRASAGPLDTLDPHEFDAIVPLRIDHYRELERHAPWRGARFIAPDLAVADLCDDKPAVAARLIERGFARHVPEIYLDSPIYPYIRKRCRGEFGVGSQMVASLSDAPDTTHDDAGWFNQAAVAGQLERALHILRIDGRTHYFQGFEYDMNGPFEIRGVHGKPKAMRRHDGSTALALFEPMLDALGFAGTCCIDYKMRDETPMVLEINPRFGGSLINDIDRYLDAYIAALSR